MPSVILRGAAVDMKGYRFNEAAAICRGIPRISPARRCCANCFNEAAAICRGIPAVSVTTARSSPRFNEAAAICRGILPPEVRRLRPGRASMRPRQYAAEYAHDQAGKGPRVLASMRPRQYAAEYARITSATAPSSRCFNEAAAICRGIPAQRVPSLDRSTSFNEAAAICRGILSRVRLT